MGTSVNVIIGRIIRTYFVLASFGLVLQSFLSIWAKLFRVLSFTEKDSVLIRVQTQGSSSRVAIWPFSHCFCFNNFPIVSLNINVALELLQFLDRELHFKDRTIF